jgi:glycosyltransferase involved in cell wall biosynthesis
MGLSPMLTTVVIPTHDRHVMVREAIGSALAQQSAEFEIIVVDDGSTDDTAAALASELGSRIHLIRTENRGVAAARNLGVAAGRGELIAFLDSDDLWLPGKLAAQVAFMHCHPEAQICQTEEIWIRNGHRVNACDHHRKPNGTIFERSLDLCLVSPSAVLMRRSLFDRTGGFDESLPACEDYDLWLRISRNTPVWLLPEALVVKRGGHADQLSRRFWGMDRFRVASLVRLLAEDGLEDDRRKATIDVLKKKCEILAAGAIRRGREEEGERYRQLAAAYR